MSDPVSVSKALCSPRTQREDRRLVNGGGGETWVKHLVALLSPK